MKQFFKKHKKLILICLVLYALAMIALLMLSRGPQNEPFIYQVW
jgi:cytochrome c-type biogenesis protein CcmE